MKFGIQLTEKQIGKQWSSLNNCFVSLSAMSQRSHLNKSKAWRVVRRSEKECKHKSKQHKPLEFHNVWFLGSGTVFTLETGNGSQRSGQATSRRVTTPNKNRYLTLNGWKTPKFECHYFSTTLSLDYWYNSFDPYCLKLTSRYRSVCSYTNGICYTLTVRYRGESNRACERPEKSNAQHSFLKRASFFYSFK